MASAWRSAASSEKRLSRSRAAARRRQSRARVLAHSLFAATRVEDVVADLFSIGYPPEVAVYDGVGLVVYP